ncbi:MAG: hypothetical protein KGN35_02280 [Betaproteobacteria bacterium]|nr:hypothetical protein [Betaproteobacteria bacterium]
MRPSAIATAANIKETLINPANEMKQQGRGTQQPWHTSKISARVSTARNEAIRSRS